MKRSPLFWLGAGAALVIVVASIVLRSTSPADPLADVARQRADVTAFNAAVEARRWNDVYTRTTEPPAHDAASFAKLMRAQVAKLGPVTDVRIDSLRLLRSRAVPMLEVHEHVTTNRRASPTASYFVWRRDRWLFAFSAPRS